MDWVKVAAIAIVIAVVVFVLVALGADLTVFDGRD